MGAVRPKDRIYKSENFEEERTSVYVMSVSSVSCNVTLQYWLVSNILVDSLELLHTIATEKRQTDVKEI